MIEIKNVSTSYVKGEKIIDNMNLTIEDGQIFGFIGPNGAGKTTTLEMITGILQIDEGDIFIYGKSIKEKPIQAKKLFISFLIAITLGGTAVAITFVNSLNLKVILHIV